MRHSSRLLHVAGFAALTLAACAAAAFAQAGPPQARPATRPNIVVVLADDMGYGDLSSYGHPTIRTPRLDQLAASGIRLTTVYAAPSCTPSRAQLITGRYPRRSGLSSVLMPDATIGMPASEVTLAELLKSAGYDTAMVGKWHMGHRDGFLPTQHGFDEYFGLLYSNDMIPPWVQTTKARRLVRGTTELPGDVDMHTLTQRYVDEAVQFVSRPRQHPFFLYLAFSMPHVPIGASPAFAGTSAGGRYGDTIEELDAETGRLLDALRERGLDQNTLVIFTSDNGPWAEMPPRMLPIDEVRATDAGSAGPFRGSKGSSWEGGVRVPMIARWPGRISAGRSSSAMVSTMDIYATVARAAGVAVPTDRPMDSHDLLPLFSGTGPSPRKDYIYFNNGDLEGIRDERWKLRTVAPAPGAVMVPLLFDMVNDPYERFDVAATHPDIVAAMRDRLAAVARAIPR
jgi:arylsulfatase A